MSAGQTVDQRLFDALQFVKVTVNAGPRQLSGHLSALSCQMLLIELGRWGFKISRTEQARKG